MKNWKQWTKDVLERTAWTAAEAGLAYGITEVSSVKASWAIPIAAALAYVKGLVAKHIGNPDSASTVPSV